MIILIKLFLNSKLDLIRTAKFVKQLFEIQKGGKVLLWNQVKYIMETYYSGQVLMADGNLEHNVQKLLLKLHSFSFCTQQIQIRKKKL